LPGCCQILGSSWRYVIRLSARGLKRCTILDGSQAATFS